MIINNTQNKRKIIKRNDSLKKVVASTIIVFSLSSALFLSKDNTILDSEEYERYSLKYLEYLRENEDEFKDNFSEVYKNVAFKYNDKVYNGSSIFIVKYDDNSVHLVDANNNKVDLLTNEAINAKRTKIVLFKESSIFYTLYESGFITENEFTLSEDIIKLLISWDGEKHYKTIDLNADLYARENSINIGGR